MDILAKLAESAAARVARDRKALPLASLRRLAERTPRPDFAFENALRPAGVSFICEIKRASPSKGVIAPDFPYLDIATDYAEAGAAAVSVLTEPEAFLGSDEHLERVAARIRLPLLQKDFTVDAYQIYRARALGASAVLLIGAILDEARLRDFIRLADTLGLSALTEVHDAREAETALRAGARVVGVNNRDLRTFEVDASNCLRLRPQIPKDVLFVAESGIRTRADVEALEHGGADAALVGETLMRAPDRRAALRALRADTGADA